MRPYGNLHRVPGLTPPSFSDALLDAVLAADPEAVVAALRGRSEEERAAVAPTLLAAPHSHYGWLVRGDGGELTWRERDTSDEELMREHAFNTAFGLAVLGTASLAQMRRSANAPRLYDERAAAAVLLGRRPPWLAG